LRIYGKIKHNKILNHIRHNSKEKEEKEEKEDKKSTIAKYLSVF
jgi:hypothetical protein